MSNSKHSKMLTVMIMVLAAALAAPAWAAGPRGGNMKSNQAYGQGGGPGAGPAIGPMAVFFQQPAVIRLKTEMASKTRELMDIFGQPVFDEVQARALNLEIREMRTRLADMQFEYMVDYKKKNLTWHPGYPQGAGSEYSQWDQTSGPAGGRGGRQKTNFPQ